MNWLARVNGLAFSLHLINLVFSNDTTFSLHSIYPYSPQRLTKRPLYLSAFTPKQFSNPLFNLLALSPSLIILSPLFLSPLFLFIVVIICYTWQFYLFFSSLFLYHTLGLTFPGDSSLRSEWQDYARDDVFGGSSFRPSETRGEIP